MRVLCINNKPLPLSHNTINHLLKEGEVYTVKRIGPSLNTNNTISMGYQLREFNIPNKLFDKRRFVPLQDTDPMLNEEPELELCDARKDEQNY